MVSSNKKIREFFKLSHVVISNSLSISDPAKRSHDEQSMSREKFGKLPPKWKADSILLVVLMVTIMMLIVVLLLYCSYKQTSQVQR